MIATPPTLNPTPKARFQQSNTRISDHRQMVQSPEFEDGAKHAMLQYQIEACQQIRDQTSAMAVGLRMQGALEFLTVFRLLAESPPPLPKATAPDTLNPRA